MKIKHTFEPDDFKGSGQLIVRNSFSPGSKDYSFAITVCYKIGWTCGKDKQKQAMISLADGMIAEFDTLDLLCKRLNEDDFGYRPMSKDEIKNILVLHGNRFGAWR